jgi:hypothetical protein
LLAAIDHRPNEPGMLLRGVGVPVDHMRRTANWFRIDAYRFAVTGHSIEIERDVWGIGRKEPPLDAYVAALRPQGHQPATKVLHLALGQAKARRRDQDDSQSGSSESCCYH